MDAFFSDNEAHWGYGHAVIMGVPTTQRLVRGQKLRGRDNYRALFYFMFSYIADRAFLSSKSPEALRRQLPSYIDRQTPVQLRSEDFVSTGGPFRSAIEGARVKDDELLDDDRHGSLAIVLGLRHPS